MAIVYTTQYRPLTDAAGLSETRDGSPLSTRAYRDLRTNVNNLYGRALPRNIVMNFWNSVLTVITSAAVIRNAHWFVPVWYGFTTIQFKVFGRNSQAGKSTTVRLYSDRALFTSAFTADAQSGTVTINSNTDAWYEGEVSPIVRTADINPPMTHLTLEMQNSDATYTSQVQILGAWLKPLADS